jgi:PmbA protein
VLDLLEHIINDAERRGANQVEAYFHSLELKRVYVKGGQIGSAEKKCDRGIGIRLAVKKQGGLSIGFAYLTDMKKVATIQPIEHALKVASSRKPEPDFEFFQERGHSSLPKRIYDARIPAIEFEDIVNVAKSSIEAASVYKRIKGINGQIDLSKMKVAILNSLGISGLYETTSFAVNTCIVAKDVNSTGVGWDDHIDCFYCGNKIFEAFSQAAVMALEQCHPKTIKTRRTDLVIQPEALASLFSYTLAQWLRADIAQKQASPFSRKINEQIASEGLKVVDDGQLPQAVGSKPFDDEGSPKHSTTLIEGGQLKELLHNACSAIKDGKENTGNAARVMLHSWKPKYALEPLIAPTNLRILPFDKSAQTSLENLVSEVDNGIIVKGIIGAHTVDNVTGEFSVVADGASKIDNGIITYPLRQTIVAGNVLNLIKSIDLLSTESKQVLSEIGEGTTIISPAMLVRNIAVSG